MLGERGQNRQRTAIALAETEQTGKLLADQFGGRTGDSGGGGAGEGGKAQRVVRLPGPVGRGTQEIGLAFGRRGRRGGLGRSGAPAGDRKRHFVSGRIGPHPEVDVAVAIGSDRPRGKW
jgi:murein DD-endopeptidase MepM/ murein hydrolase activator NlpD